MVIESWQKGLLTIRYEEIQNDESAAISSCFAELKLNNFSNSLEGKSHKYEAATLHVGRALGENNMPAFRLGV